MKQKTDKKKYKILLLNLGYCTGINGSTFEYLLNSYRYVYIPKRIEDKVLQTLRNIISEEKPDLICLVEIKKGKQIATIINDTYFFYDIETKYGEKSILRKLPFFHNKSNAFISNQKLSYKKHFLKNGTKSLLYEIIIPNNISLFLMHFSLKADVRAKQFEEIHMLSKDREQKIICGDFNIFGGVDELTYLMEHSNMALAHYEPTFPSFKPEKSLDLFLCSKNIKTKTRVRSDQLSDHLPVVLEIEI